MSASRVALLSVLLGASVALATPVHGVAQEGPEGQKVQVVTHNRSSGKVWVYVLQEGHMIPLGLVDAMGNATLSIPPAYAHSGMEIQLVADPLGSAAWFKSDPVRIRDGQSSLAFTIASDLHSSSVSATG